MLTSITSWIRSPMIAGQFMRLDTTFVNLRLICGPLVAVEGIGWTHKALLKAIYSVVLDPSLWKLQQVLLQFTNVTYWSHHCLVFTGSHTNRITISGVLVPAPVFGSRPVAIMVKSRDQQMCCAYRNMLSTEERELWNTVAVRWRHETLLIASNRWTGKATTTTTGYEGNEWSRVNVALMNSMMYDVWTCSHGIYTQLWWTYGRWKLEFRTGLRRVIEGISSQIDRFVCVFAFARREWNVIDYQTQFTFAKPLGYMLCHKLYTSKNVYNVCCNQQNQKMVEKVSRLV